MKIYLEKHMTLFVLAFSETMGMGWKIWKSVFYVVGLGFILFLYLKFKIKYLSSQISSNVQWWLWNLDWNIMGSLMGGCGASHGWSSKFVTRVRFLARSGCVYKQWGLQIILIDFFRVLVCNHDENSLTDNIVSFRLMD